MQREISYEWSPEFVRLSSRRFVSRYARRSLVICFILVATGIVGLILHGGTGWFWWLVFGSPAAYFGFWHAYYDRVKNIHKEMPDHHVSVRVEDESVTFLTSERPTTLKWTGIKEVWSYPDVLLLFTRDRHTYTALPVEALGEDLKRYIEDKVRQHGKVVA